MAMSSAQAVSGTVALRAPDKVMRLERMGAFHQTRLSFMRILLRRLAVDNWQFSRPAWDVDEAGVGTALYTASGPQHTYTLIAFAHDLDPELRSDRVIAQAWDATFTLFDGIPDVADIERLRTSVPLQEAGHLSACELTLSRANRSVRMFEYVVSSLASGAQPQPERLAEVGYLMRTTAVYGSGKFGAQDRFAISDRAEFSPPFQVELLTVFLIRAFSVDIVEHLAKIKSPVTAVALAPELRRSLGVGNSTGLGMAPFLVHHPILLDRWITARETALSRVRSIANIEPQRERQFRTLLGRLVEDAERWHTAHVEQSDRIEAYKSDLWRLRDCCTERAWQDRPLPFDGLYKWAEQHLTIEGQEALVGAMIEVCPELVDELVERMHIDEAGHFAIDGSMTVAQLKQLLLRNYAFALAYDFSERSNDARFWYVSEEKLEPRLGERYNEDGAELEHPLAVARDVVALKTALDISTDETRIADFLLSASQHRHVVRRVQASANHPYAEIRDNVISATMLPIDILRCKLSFFGATKFDPRSDRWTRITMFQNAPYPAELQHHYEDDWVYTAAASE